MGVNRAFVRRLFRVNRGKALIAAKTRAAVRIIASPICKFSDAQQALEPRRAKSAAKRTLRRPHARLVVHTNTKNYHLALNIYEQ